VAPDQADGSYVMVNLSFYVTHHCSVTSALAFGLLQNSFEIEETALASESLLGQFRII
jgi:hypothetical protein